MRERERAETGGGGSAFFFRPSLLLSPLSLSSSYLVLGQGDGHKLLVKDGLRRKLGGGVADKGGLSGEKGWGKRKDERRLGATPPREKKRGGSDRRKKWCSPSRAPACPPLWSPTHCTPSFAGARANIGSTLLLDRMGGRSRPCHLAGRLAVGEIGSGFFFFFSPSPSLLSPNNTHRRLADQGGRPAHAGADSAGPAGGQAGGGEGGGAEGEHGWRARGAAESWLGKKSVL